MGSNIFWRKKGGSMVAGKRLKIGKATVYVAVGIGILGAVHIRRKWKTSQNKSIDDGTASATWNDTSVGLLQTVPTRILSRGWGNINELTLPTWLRSPLLGFYASTFNCNMAEAVETDFEKYNNLQEFFNRRLKPGLRPIQPALINSPADCKVLACGEVDSKGFVDQVKGVRYNVSHLLGESVGEAQEGNALFHCVLYLAPGDYHRFHSPVEWTSDKLTHIAGDLLSVAPSVAKAIPGLFCLNERVVQLGNWEHGSFYFCAVGAYNVGSIVMEGNPKIHTNGRNDKMTQKIDYPCVQPILKKGDEVGRFRLGSTIILVFEAPKGSKFVVSPGQKLKVGQSIMQ
eukprot:m.105936 g.105936  ORF g.105936 m.105936 type:complete len:343 (+) comp9143_c0_seq2:1-1029(+)